MVRFKVGVIPLIAVTAVALLIVRAVYAARKATVMFITGAPWQHLPQIEPYFDGARFNVWPWNYVFLDFPIWGDYFRFASSDEYINSKLAYFRGLGFKNLLYIDPTEIHKDFGVNFPDCILEEGDWWARMTLDPSKSWYKYLKEGMLGLTERFSETIDGFAIDRLDRAITPQELNWGVQLIDEVREESLIPVEYCMNSLQSWQSKAASRAAFIGSDGVNVDYLDSAMQLYGSLATHTSLKKYYLVGRTYWMPGGVEQAISDLRKILAKHPFIFIEDNMASTYIPALFP